MLLVVEHRDHCTKTNIGVVWLGGEVDHLDLIDLLSEVPQATIDLAEPLLPVDVGGILRTVTLLCRGVDLPNYLRALDMPEMRDLCLDRIDAFLGHRSCHDPPGDRG